MFSGDTLFSAGCGKLFEGSAAQMHTSLVKLAALPDATRVCCGHEYTVSEPALRAGSRAGQRRRRRRTCARAQATRARGEPTLPSTIGLERRINPFVRVAEPAVIDAAVAHGATGSGGTEVLAAIRTWKNEFR